MTLSSCAGGFQSRYRRDAPTAASASATDFGLPRSALGFSPAFSAGLKFTRPSAGSRLLGEYLLSWRARAGTPAIQIAECGWSAPGESCPEQTRRDIESHPTPFTVPCVSRYNPRRGQETRPAQGCSENAQRDIKSRLEQGQERGFPRHRAQNPYREWGSCLFCHSPSNPLKSACGHCVLGRLGGRVF